MRTLRGCLWASLIFGIVLTLYACVAIPGGQKCATVATTGLVMVIVAVLLLYATAGYAADSDPNSLTNLMDKDPQDLTTAQKNKILRYLDDSFSRGNITLMEYDVLKAKYTGTQSLTQTFGFDYMNAASRQCAANQAIEKQNKSIDNRIIASGVVGDAIGGLGGSVVGIATAANQINQENQQLLAEKAAADAELEAAKQRLIHKD